MKKNIFEFKTFRKNFVFVCLCIVLYTVMDCVNHISVSIIQIVEMDFLLFLLFILLGMITDTVKNINKQNKEMKNVGFGIQSILLIIVLTVLIFIDIFVMAYLR